MKIKFLKMDPNAEVPTYATAGAAGADLRSIESVTIPPKSRGLVSTGIAIELPEGFEAQVRSRSGLALKAGLSVLNSPGTIDSDYRGAIGVILHNSGITAYTVEPGERIAQLVVAPVVQVEFEEADELSVADRGEGGFGSTGKQ